MSETYTAWRYNRPENGEPETKVVNDTTYIFFKKIGWWNPGGIRHSSDDHKTTDEMIKIKYYSRNVAEIHDGNPHGGGSVHLMGSLFFVSVHRIPGNEVADDRD